MLNWLVPEDIKEKDLDTKDDGDWRLTQVKVMKSKKLRQLELDCRGMGILDTIVEKGTEKKDAVQEESAQKITVVKKDNPKVLPKRIKTGKIGKKESRRLAEKNSKVTSWMLKSKLVVVKKADLTEVEDMEWMDIAELDSGVEWIDEEDTEKIFREAIVKEKRDTWKNWKWMKELVMELADTAKTKTAEEAAEETLNVILSEAVWRIMAGEMTNIFLADGRMKEEVLSRLAESDRLKSSQERASKLEKDIEELGTIMLEWTPLGRAQDEESVLRWMMEEYENLDVIMEEAEDRERRRQDDTMRKGDTESMKDDDKDAMKTEEFEYPGMGLEVSFEEWVVGEMAELGYDVDTGDWGQDDLDDIKDDWDEVCDKAAYALTKEVVADNYFNGGTWYLNNWREIPPTSEVVHGKNICVAGGKNKLGCADISELDLAGILQPNKRYSECECLMSETPRKRCRRAAFYIQKCPGVTKVVGQINNNISLNTVTHKHTDMLTSISNRVKLSARRRLGDSRSMAKSKVMSKDVEMGGTVNMYEVMDTDTDQDEQEQMEVGSQPVGDQMEMEVVEGSNTQDEYMELELMKTTQKKVNNMADVVMKEVVEDRTMMDVVVKTIRQKLEPKQNIKEGRETQRRETGPEDGQREAHRQGAGGEGDGDHGDVPGGVVQPDDQVKSIQASRPQALWKVKRRRGGVGQDNLVQSRLSFFMDKYPNLKLRDGVKPNFKVSAEKSEKNENEIIHTLSLPGVGGEGGMKRKTGD